MSDLSNSHSESPRHALHGPNPEGLSDTDILHSLISGLDEVSVILVDRDARFLRCTDITARRLGFTSPHEIVGKTLNEIAPQDWAIERINTVRKTIDLGTQTSLLSIMHGRRTQTIFNPIKLPDGSSVVLVTVEQITPERFDALRQAENDETMLVGEVNVLGALEVLSPRELEVLALLGQGHRPKDIATMLSRSLSTIDGHRERIGEKLGVRDRAALMTLARKAALRVDDAERARNSISPKPRPDA